MNPLVISRENITSKCKLGAGAQIASQKES